MIAIKIARLKDGDRETYGIIHNDMMATKEEITYSTGIPIPNIMRDFLFDGWLDEIRKEKARLVYGHKLSEFELLPPIPDPPKILCLAFNYIDHAKEQNLTPPRDPALVIKPRTALVGSGSSIRRPDFVSQLDYEVELALIISKTARDIAPEDATDAIFGYTILNDVSARDIQHADKQFTRGKGCDTFAPCGPWIVTRDEIADPHNLRLTTRVNGNLRQDSNTSLMFLKIPDIISKISRCMTLERGDIISTGTPAGVMLNKPNAEFLKPGDEIEMEIEQIGVLRNTIRDM